MLQLVFLPINLKVHRGNLRIQWKVVMVVLGTCRPPKKDSAALKKESERIVSPYAMRYDPNRVEIEIVGLWKSETAIDRATWDADERQSEIPKKMEHTHKKRSTQKKRVEYNIIIIRSKAAEISYYLIWNWAALFAHVFLHRYQ